jgi:hypothetical protein
VVPVNSQCYLCLQPAGAQGQHKPKDSQTASACPDIPVQEAKHRASQLPAGKRRVLLQGAIWMTARSCSLACYRL